MFYLSVSIVIYHSDSATLSRGIHSLHTAVVHMTELRPDLGNAVHLIIVDNAGEPGSYNGSNPQAFPGLQALNLLKIDVLAGHGNVGYGAGHNLAIQQVRSRYHLILNPDVYLAPDALLNALTFLEGHPETVLLAPRVCGGDDRLQYLCRRYPTVLDLFVRGFLPKAWRKMFELRLACYELRKEIDAREPFEDAASPEILQPPIVSGCFMLFRTHGLRCLKGFDPRYFLYFEDYDLSLRASEIGEIAYVPTVNIIHLGGGAARKGILHIRLFFTSAVRFFHRFGWRLL